MTENIYTSNIISAARFSKLQIFNKLSHLTVTLVAHHCTTCGMVSQCQARPVVLPEMTKYKLINRNMQKTDKLKFYSKKSLPSDGLNSEDGSLTSNFVLARKISTFSIYNFFISLI